MLALTAGCRRLRRRRGRAAAPPAAAAEADSVKVGLITKTETNPFFVKMKEGADAKAQELGAELQSFAGKKDGDNESQVAAVESLISAGAKGFMITPSDSKAIVPVARQGAPGRPAGDRARHADRAAGRGRRDVRDRQLRRRARRSASGRPAKFEDGKDAKIAMLDLNPDGVSVDVQRDQGFLRASASTSATTRRSATSPTRASSVTT